MAAHQHTPSLPVHEGSGTSLPPPQNIGRGEQSPRNRRWRDASEKGYGSVTHNAALQRRRELFGGGLGPMGGRLCCAGGCTWLSSAARVPTVVCLRLGPSVDVKPALLTRRQRCGPRRSIADSSLDCPTDPERRGGLRHTALNGIRLAYIIRHGSSRRPVAGAAVWSLTLSAPEGTHQPHNPFPPLIRECLRFAVHYSKA